MVDQCVSSNNMHTPQVLVSMNKQALNSSYDQSNL